MSADAVGYLLGIIALFLTCTMFVTRQPMLGFPSALFWAIFGAYNYTLSTIPWGDIYYYLAFGSLLGMVPFTALGAYGLREKRDTIADEEMERGEGNYIDEKQSKETSTNDVEDLWGDEETRPRPSRRTLELRERAEKRRKGEFPLRGKR